MATPKKPSRLDRVEIILDKLTSSLSALAGAVMAHDNVIEAHDRQIDALIKVGELQDRRLGELGQRMDQLDRRWQAYLNTLPRQ